MMKVILSAPALSAPALSAAVLAGLMFFSMNAASEQTQGRWLKVTIAVNGMMKSKSGAI